MKIIVDADACPVKAIIEQLAQDFHVPLVLVASIEHRITSGYGQVVVVDHEPEAADLYIVNHTGRDDIVVTQDLGLAALVLARGAIAITPTGYTPDANKMDTLLNERYINKKARRQGYRIGRTRPRSHEDDKRFADELKYWLVKLTS